MSKLHLLKRFKISALTSTVVAITLLLSSAPAFAAPFATVSLSASPSTVIKDASTVVTINVNTGSTVTDGGEVKISYDQTKLEYSSPNYAGTPFNSDSPNYSGGGGTVIISRYTSTPPGPSGAFVLAKLTFKALVSSGTSPITINQAASYFSDHASATDSAPSSVSNTTITFAAAPVAPAPTCAAGQTGTYPNCVTPKCATGQTGTYPNCVTPTGTVVKTCAAGQTGTYPNCVTPTKAGTSTTPATTTPAATTPAATTSPAVTTAVATTPEGDPAPASPALKKASSRVLLIGGLTTVVVLAAAAGAFMFIRRRNMGMMGFSHGAAPMVSTAPSAATMDPSAPINKIPPADSKAPGEVVQPNNPVDPHV